MFQKVQSDHNNEDNQIKILTKQKSNHTFTKKKVDTFTHKKLTKNL